MAEPGDHPGGGVGGGDERRGSVAGEEEPDYHGPRLGDAHRDQHADGHAHAAGQHDAGAPDPVGEPVGGEAGDELPGERDDERDPGELHAHSADLAEVQRGPVHAEVLDESAEQAERDDAGEERPLRGGG